MSNKLMSDERQEFLVKCAEQTIELMNIGVTPNAALTKVAKDAELNSKEVALVSHAINNSKTLSVLATSEDKDKDKPFTITNAELVNQNLYDADPKVDAAASKDEKAADKEADKPVGQQFKNKKEAAALSCQEASSYLDADPVDHASAFRAAVGTDEVVHRSMKCAAVIDHETGEASFTIENEDARETHNPYHKLASIRIQAEEASLLYTHARQQAMDGIDKLANEFRRMDSPAFDRVETAAILAGVDPQTPEIIYEMAELSKLGHKRAGVVKTAGEFRMSQREATLSNVMCDINEAWIKAANALTVKHILDEAHQVVSQKIAQYLEKVSAAKSDKPDKEPSGITPHLKDVGDQATRLSVGLSSVPEQLSGADFHGKSKAIDLLQSASGDYGDGPEYEQPNKTPNGVEFRQELNGVDTRGKIDNLLQDEFIRQHPIQDVVSAYNRALSVNPNLGHAELSSLVKQDLAAGGAVPLDTLLRTSTSHPSV